MTYAAPIKDMRFVLQQLVGLERVAALPGCEHVGTELTDAILEEAGKFAADVLAPLNRTGDTQGARHANGAVTTPDGFKNAYAQFVAGGWNALACDPDHGGEGLPADKSQDGGAFTPIQTRVPPPGGLTVFASRSTAIYSDLDIWFGREGLTVAERKQAGSSLKFSLIAEGLADLYPRFGPTCEWDIAAGHAILDAAGGEIVTTDGKPLLYGKPKFLNPHFIARSKAAR